MKVGLVIQGPARAWHERLEQRLAASGHRLALSALPKARGDTWGVRLLLAAEGRLYRARAPLYAPIDRSMDGSGPADLRLEILCDGQSFEPGLIAALLRGQAPSIVVRGFIGSVWVDLARGLPAIENPDVLATGLDQVLARSVELVLQALRAAADGSPPASVSPLGPRNPPRSPLAFFVRAFARKLARRFGPARGRPDHWSIGFRQSGENDFTLLPDNGSQFQADPFLFDYAGRVQLFFEAFPYATGKGVIARVALDKSGMASPPLTVLDLPYHLSYPLVLKHGSAIYMLPETSAARRIQLFRADPFPDRWVADRILVDDVVASDATPILHEGTYWLFATLSGDGGSSWDQLALFHAPDLLGPWESHASNPVLIDAGAARPAGLMWHEGGVLMRVAQDCRAGYGAALAICRVDRLDRDGYAQTIVERIEPPIGSGAMGLHTRNQAGGYEVVDLKRPHAWRP